MASPGTDCIESKAITLHLKGNVRSGQKRWNDSIHFYLQAYQMYQNSSGNGTYRTAAVLSQLGQQHQHVGQLEKAKSVKSMNYYRPFE